MEQVKISVVIPTYKRKELLGRCLSALIRQSLDKNNFEIIVVSDGTDDESKTIVSRILENNCRYKFLSLAEKGGPAAARNLGWKNSSGELVAFTDDDCIPDKHWLEAFCNTYRGEENAAYTGSIIVPVNGRPTDFAKNTANLENAEFVTANCCLSRRALELTGGFDERFMMAWREDSDLEFRLLSNSITVRRIQAALVVHPVRSAKWGVSISEQRKGIFNALLYKKYPSLYRAKIQAAPPWNYYVIVLSSIITLIALILNATLLALISLCLAGFLLIKFMLLRLADTSHSVNHVLEMIITSIAIPFLSVYWQLYGSVKYRVLFF